MAHLAVLAIVLVVILLASVALAVALSWVIGAVTALIQHRRAGRGPDFRQQGRDE